MYLHRSSTKGQEILSTARWRRSISISSSCKERLSTGPIDRSCRISRRFLTTAGQSCSMENSIPHLNLLNGKSSVSGSSSPNLDPKRTLRSSNPFRGGNGLIHCSNFSLHQFWSALKWTNLGTNIILCHNEIKKTAAVTWIFNLDRFNEIQSSTYKPIEAKCKYDLALTMRNTSSEQTYLYTQNHHKLGIKIIKISQRTWIE